MAEGIPDDETGTVQCDYIVTHVTHTVSVYQSRTRTETGTAQLAVTNHLQNKIRTDNSAN